MRGPEPDARGPAQVSSWWILAGFAAIAAVAALARLPAPVTATLLALLLGLLVVRHPANGLAALVLTSPFVLGEQKTPYFLLHHALAVGVLLSFLAHRLLGRVRLVPYYGGALLFFAGAAAIALPLNLRDLLEDLWLFRSLDWAPILAQGIPDISHLHYLDRVLVALVGAGLFAIAAQPSMRPAVEATLLPLAGLVAVLSAFGLLRFFGVIRTSGAYLTLSFWTWQNPDLRLTAVAWNPDYLALFLVLAIPLFVALACGAAPRWQRTLAAAAAAVGTAALLLTFQRAAYVALLVALGTLVWLSWRAAPRRVAWPWLLAVAAIALAAGAALDAWVLQGRIAGRFLRIADDPNRIRLWATALRMGLDHPLLGVGTGRYAFFFREYAGLDLPRDFGPFWGTAHSQYLHLLAEQGLVGVASFVALFGAVWLGTIRRLPALPPGAALLARGIVAALTGWLVYGVVQFTFRVPALVYLACIVAGTAVALAPPARQPAWSRRWAAAAVAVALVIVAFRAEAALRRPVSPGYDAGFYRWERQPDGSAGRWTRGRAAMAVPVQGRVMTLRFRAPIPGIEARPQVARVMVNHRPMAVLTLATTGWHTLEVPVADSPGTHALVEVDVAYTFRPSELTPSEDDRRLGVMVGEVAWRD
ncbi:MAG TPA: O-antigen ligase family protein [Methylomirabilota bacterium]|nr:O-antigen ligase family protein [Methylomirabilota bacterium]